MFTKKKVRRIKVGWVFKSKMILHILNERHFILVITLNSSKFQDPVFNLASKKKHRIVQFRSLINIEAFPVGISLIGS